jgi:hypothetical protein
MAPCADNKLTENEDADVVRMRQRLLKVRMVSLMMSIQILKYCQASASLAMKSLRRGPPEILSHILINAELLNTPALGDEDNVAYTAAQLNISPAEKHHSSKLVNQSYSQHTYIRYGWNPR